MISYVLATNKPRYCAENTIRSIENVKGHGQSYDYEIIVVSDDESNNDGNVHFIKDTENQGSAHAFNIGAAAAKGDWVVIVVDDHDVPENLLDFSQCPNFITQSYQQTICIGNLTKSIGGPGHSGYNKEIKSTEGFWTLDNVVPPSDPVQEPYQVVHFPMIWREHLELLGGKLFNPRFKHHYVDHWLGLYTQKVNGFIGQWPSNVWYGLRPDNAVKQCEHYDWQDHQLFLELRSKLYAGTLSSYLD